MWYIIYCWLCNILVFLALKMGEISKQDKSCNLKMLFEEEHVITSGNIS